MQAFATSVVKVQRASGAARIVARQLLTQLGHPDCSLPKGVSGHRCGRLASSARWLMMLESRSQQLECVPLSVRWASTLSRPSACRPSCWTWSRRHKSGSNWVTTLTADDCSSLPKEAVYKAVHPLDQIFLEHHDVEINLAERKAVVRNGRVVELRLSTSAHHLVALAFLRAADRRSTAT